MRRLPAIAALAIVVALLTACSTPAEPSTRDTAYHFPVTARPLVQPATDAGYRLTGINVNEPGTYPKMPSGYFTYVDESTGRIHFEVDADLSEVAAAGRAGSVARNRSATVLLFADGTGLVLTGNDGIVVGLGLVEVNYSVPPDWSGGPTVVLIHSITGGER